MPVTAVLAVLAALVFGAFHLPVDLVPKGRPAMLAGIGYHVLLLPAVAALPAPDWARAAGLAWMLLDIVVDGATAVGLAEEVAGQLRQGVHLVSVLWVLGAGATAGGYLLVAGVALSAAFLARFACCAGERTAPRPLLHANAALNVCWMLCVAATLS